MSKKKDVYNSEKCFYRVEKITIDEAKAFVDKHKFEVYSDSCWRVPNAPICDQCYLLDLSGITPSLNGKRSMVMVTIANSLKNFEGIRIFPGLDKIVLTSTLGYSKTVGICMFTTAFLKDMLHDCLDTYW